MNIKPCGDSNCKVSTGIHEGLTFGQGELCQNGFWEIPCSICARDFEKHNPEYYPCWPFDDYSNRVNFDI